MGGLNPVVFWPQQMEIPGSPTLLEWTKSTACITSKICSGMPPSGVGRLNNFFSNFPSAANANTMTWVTFDLVFLNPQSDPGEINFRKFHAIINFRKNSTIFLQLFHNFHAFSAISAKATIFLLFFRKFPEFLHINGSGRWGNWHQQFFWNHYFF